MSFSFDAVIPSPGKSPKKASSLPADPTDKQLTDSIEAIPTNLLVAVLDDKRISSTVNLKGRALKLLKQRIRLYRAQQGHDISKSLIALGFFFEVLFPVIRAIRQQDGFLNILKVLANYKSDRLLRQQATYSSESRRKVLARILAILGFAGITASKLYKTYAEKNPIQ